MCVTMRNVSCGQVFLDFHLLIQMEWSGDENNLDRTKVRLKLVVTLVFCTYSKNVMFDALLG